MKLYIIDVCRDKTIIHRVDVEDGYYGIPRMISGDFMEQTKLLKDIVEKERPDKIIFDKHSFGYMLFEMFSKYVKMDESGRIEW